MFKSYVVSQMHMVRFSDRANSIRPTGVRRMFDMAGDDAIQFGLGEPDFQPPQLAIDAFDKAMRDGRNKYTTLLATRS